ncbi:TolC family protein [Jeongeupia chitinilytica]|uniref:Copper resistance-related lipoprotein n=1 Tax=Jeongeupia chitinilytica TaxID=1041641 RepID=A0ABQ3GXM5_9NEIS|nr:TolC family protein [Jeongeupia chitinilytica]GHD58642.1 copper resistance-related lipoprotein [Jeongeupia chitinilytica]
MTSGRRLAVIAAALVLSGCASVDFDESVAQANRDAADFTQGKLALASTDVQRDAMRDEAAKLLDQPLGQTGAVQVALLNSLALQALLAQNWADAAAAAQGGRLPNPVFSFERMTIANELEFGRLLAFGLLDLITLPQRYNTAQRQIAAARLRLTGDVVNQVTQVRQAWVNAVAAQQTLVYTRQVFEAAEASAELARRLQSVGNFTKLDRARQQAFYADAATQLAGAQHAATAAREALVRQLGLDDAQAQQLKLPDRLPALPKSPRSADDTGKAASSTRMDVRQARMSLDAAVKAQGLNWITSFADIELGLRYDTVFDTADGAKNHKRGFEVDVRLPLFDWGDLQRDAMNAQTLAAANRYEATLRAAGSNLRESYSAYRTSFDIARHYRDEVVPLRKTISEENTLRYNGMLIGVFELLADSRDQVGAVIGAIGAEQQFWLADAALQAAVLGRPGTASVAVAASAGGGGGEAGH